MESRTPSARVQRRQQRTRAQLVRAASALIADKGVEGLRLREVTDAADVGFGSFYNYFESKEVLVEAVAQELMVSLAGTLGAGVEAFSDPAEAASAAHRWFVRTAVEDPETARLLVNLDQADVRFQERILPFGQRLLEAGVEQGRFLPRTSPLTTVHYVVGATLAVTRGVLDGRVGADAECETAEVLLQALGVDAAQAREVAHRALPSVATVKRVSAD
jgi:AcrR family transcriptional regulator